VGYEMEKSVESMFSDAVLREAEQHFDLKENQCHKIGDFENYVFQVIKNEEPYILRLTHSSHRTEDQVLAELNWINYLKGQGVDVASSFSSKNGNLVERIEVEDSYFYACLFEKEPGKPIDLQGKSFNTKLFYLWGETIGNMHAATKNYKLSSNEPKRPEWYEDDLLDYRKFIPASQTRVIEQADKLLHELNQAHKGKDVYGLIHGDVHSHNFFSDEDKIYVFDFDDSSYHWFASDIAIPLYYAAWFKFPEGNNETRSAFSHDFLTHFLKGYISEYTLDFKWIEEIPTFLKLRDIILYSVLHKKWDLSKLNEKQDRLLKEIKNRIENGEPIVHVDYQEVKHVIESLDRKGKI
jgi:Ser/Thr protein kinase RdoA (MazF antagonist)